MDFINLERTSSVAFRPNGVYKGKVVEVDNTTNTVSLILPRVNGKAVRDRCKVLSTVMPSVGDEVGCVFAENQASEVYVLGIIRNTQSDVDQFQFGIVTLDNNGIGVGTPTASQPLSIAQTSGTDYVSYNKSASAGLTNASAGAVIIGKATGPNVVVDSTTYAANNGTGASTALTGTVVQARNNGNPAALYLNPNGGDVRLEAGGLVVNGNVSTLAGSSGRLEMPLSATYIDSGTMNFSRLGMAYPTSSAPAASATPVGHHYYNTQTHEFLVNSGTAYSKPWNMPWGYLGSQRLGSVSIPLGSQWYQLPNSLTINNLPANRRLRVSCAVQIFNQAVSWVYLVINRSVNGQSETNFASVKGVIGTTAPTHNGQDWITLHVNNNFDTSPSGSVTYKVYVNIGIVGTNSHADDAHDEGSYPLTVEDVGPAGNPTTGTFLLDSPSRGILDQNILG